MLSLLPLLPLLPLLLVPAGYWAGGIRRQYVEPEY